MKSDRGREVLHDLLDFLQGLSSCSWDTVLLALEIAIEYFLQAVQLLLALLVLAVRVAFLIRELCVDALATFARVIDGLVHVISDVTCEEIEDLVRACLVMTLWVFVGRQVGSAAWATVRELIPENPFRETAVKVRTVQTITDNIQRGSGDTLPPNHKRGRKKYCPVHSDPEDSIW